MVGICLLSQPYLAVGAVVVIGVVVVGIAISEELEAHERSHRPGPEAEDSVETARPESPPVAPTARVQPSGLGRDWFPPQPPASPDPRERRSECTPKRVPPKGGNSLHNTCADNVPLNSFRGANALVNGKAFDALQPATRTLWEVKTDNFDTYSPALQSIVSRKQVMELRSSRTRGAGPVQPRARPSSPAGPARAASDTGAGPGAARARRVGQVEPGAAQPPRVEAGLPGLMEPARIGQVERAP
ncbi:DUF6310 domain-containing protein [Hyalangium rubrum]|uniref:DUF6310 domain-containing protein n=1 Tax=Hyalangium rubrum TaxID=3103134 RepID=A0ABU5H2R6_9BACT|nr:DUF6310 domain-containing protein [Hyalangium sp. s54d21]MDY7227606.1 DUF6310 domain-containing protein [Hyalangium sp. s54d21]